MGFRDETQALRHQRDLLEREVHTLAAERVRLQDQIAETKRAVDVRVAAGVAGAGVGPAIGILAVALAIGLVSLIPGDANGSTTVLGRVRSVSGDAPIAAGAPCTAFLEFLDRDDDSTSSRLEVICAERVIYGAGDSGYLDCEYDDERVVSCRDTEFSSTGGDPRLALDRVARTLVIEDRAPTWRAEIDLTVVPGEGS